MNEQTGIAKTQSLFLKIRNGWLLIFFTSALLLSFSISIQAQTTERKNDLYSFPFEYSKLTSDTARMRFLVPIIQDSLDEGQLSHVYAWAQEGLRLAELNRVDTMQGIFKYFIGKAFTYYYNKYDSAIYYYKQVITYFPDKLKKYNVLSIREIMDRYSDLGNKDSSFVYMNQLKDLIDTMPDSSPRKISLSQNIAVVFQGFGMYRSAIRYYQVAVNGNRKNKNFRGLGIALANVGELYSQMDDLDNAIINSKEGLNYLEDVKMPFMQTASNLADYYYMQHQFDSSMVYLQLSTKIAEQLNDAETKLINQSILAKIYTARKQFTKAKALFEKTIAAFTNTDNYFSMCRVLLSYADLDTCMHAFENARAHLEQALAIANKSQFLPFKVSALEKLALLDFKTGNYQSAFETQKRFANLKDSMAIIRSKSDLNDLEVSYKTTQKEQEIILLRKDNEIKNLQLENSNRLKLFFLLLSGFLAILFAVIYYQRNKRNMIQTKKVKAELMTRVLRSQMNPHFIFNSLNSIENFIMQNEKRLASDYLNKFSSLIRSMLDSSRNEVVPLAKDIEALKLYVELEQLRFNSKFSYQSFIDPQLVYGDYRVPSLLIQPFVENAIVHGIAHSTSENLQLTVMAVLENDIIKYIIQDNGVGRKKAAEYNLKNKPHHKSVGLKITEERISYFNKTETAGDAIRFIDLTNEYNEPVGTKVEIQIKAV